MTSPIVIYTMNVCIRNTFVSLWLILGTLSLSAQGPSFYFPFINDAAPGSTKLMPLKAVNLDSVVSVQMVFRWDPTLLQFVNIDNFNLDDLSFGNFNLSFALSEGYIRMQWEGDSQTPGVSVPDSSTILRLRFKVIGPDSVCAPVEITEILDFPPLNFEILKVRPDTSIVAYNIDESTLTEGNICIGFTLSAAEPGANEIPISLAPNPFLVSAQLNFELDEAADTQLIISDAMGRIVLQKDFFRLPPGQHGMVIENDLLGAAGLYFLTLRAGRKITTHKFVTF